MTVMELGALGEFLGVFALVATLLYLSIQVRHARGESEKAVLEARTTGLRELALGVATSDGLSAALVKAIEAIGGAPNPFEAKLISRGLDRQEADRVNRWYFAQWFLHSTQYQDTRGAQRIALDPGFRAVYASGLGRLFWGNFRPQGALPATGEVAAFEDYVNQLIAEADQQQETQQ